MTTNKSIETDALNELVRIERFENLTASGERLEETEIISALCDKSEPIRAEALDYLAGISPTAKITELVKRVGELETAVQCVARIVFLSYVWHDPAIRASLSFRPSIDESEYIFIWEDAGKALIAGDLGAAIRLIAHAQYSDWELRTVAKNLVKSLSEMSLETRVMLERIDRSLTQIK